MTSPFGSPPPPGAIPPPPPPMSGAPPPPGYGAGPPGSGTAPPPGYQAYSPSPVGGYERASFGARFGAWLLDYLLYGLLVTALTAPGVILIVTAFSDCNTTHEDGFCGDGDFNGASFAGGVLLVLLAAIAVFVLYIRALGNTGQTWGRKIVGVKVVGEMTGEPIGVGKAFGRQLFASFISGQIMYLGYLWMLWDDKKQTWHDKVVGSIVIKV